MGHRGRQLRPKSEVSANRYMERDWEGETYASKQMILEIEFDVLGGLLDHFQDLTTSVFC